MWVPPRARAQAELLLHRPTSGATVPLSTAHYLCDLLTLPTPDNFRCVRGVVPPPPPPVTVVNVNVNVFSLGLSNATEEQQVVCV